jgi:hypothetical protein
MWHRESNLQPPQRAKTGGIHQSSRGAPLRCARHRRIITDYLIVEGKKVFHILRPGQIDAATMRLADGGGVVLHPRVCEPWAIHPFCISPTATWVQQADQGWWAPCIWRGCGIAVIGTARATAMRRISLPVLTRRYTPGAGSPPVCKIPSDSAYSLADGRHGLESFIKSVAFRL